MKWCVFAEGFAVVADHVLGQRVGELVPVLRVERAQIPVLDSLNLLDITHVDIAAHRSMARTGVDVAHPWVGWRRGVPVHTLEVFGAVFFAVLAVLVMTASDDVIGWLETWAGDLSNIALAGFATVTLLIRRPFTMAYAKDTTPARSGHPMFQKINYAISGVWAAAFAFSAVGDVVLHDGDGFWTGACRWQARCSPCSSRSSIPTTPRQDSLSAPARQAIHRRHWCG